MPGTTIEVYVRDLSEAEASDWLRTCLGDLTPVRKVPVAVYDGTHDGGTVRVQITERVQDGPYTSIWLRGDPLPWADTSGCARAVHDATGAEVLCYPDHNEDAPWMMLHLQSGTAQRIDERTIDF